MKTRIRPKKKKWRLVVNNSRQQHIWYYYKSSKRECVWGLVSSSWKQPSLILNLEWAFLHFSWPSEDWVIVVRKLQVEMGMNYCRDIIYGLLNTKYLDRFAPSFSGLYRVGSCLVRPIRKPTLLAVVLYFVCLFFFCALAFYLRASLIGIVKGF